MPTKWIVVRDFRSPSWIFSGGSESIGGRSMDRRLPAARSPELTELSDFHSLLSCLAATPLRQPALPEPRATARHWLVRAQTEH